MYAFSEEFVDLCHRIEVEPGDGFGTARIAQALYLPYEQVDALLQGTLPADAFDADERDSILTKLCVVVTEFERNKRAYREWKKTYGFSASRRDRLRDKAV